MATGNPSTDRAHRLAAIKQKRLRERARSRGLDLSGIETKFWARVRKGDGCWEWTKSTHLGYGRIVYHAQDLEAHRVSWILAHGPIPDGLWVLHHCDNRLCVRPDHLFLGDIIENTRDRDRKGRGYRVGRPLIGLAYRQNERRRPPRGEQHPHAKLSEADVLEIIRRRKAGETLVSPAREFGLNSPAGISAIALRRSWRHVQPEAEKIA